MYSSSGGVDGGGGTAPSLTASAIVARDVSGSHILKIDGYSRTKELATGKWITSEEFTVGGHRWCMLYYPAGDRKECADWISVYLLRLDHTHVKEVKAHFTISLLDQDGNPVPSYIKPSQPTDCNFSSVGIRGFCKFIRRKDLEKSVYLKDDVFSVRCDVTVAKEIFTQAIPAPAVRRGIKEERHAWHLRA